MIPVPIPLASASMPVLADFDLRDEMVPRAVDGAGIAA
jgi:hypothetical protein